jgi:RNA polymerase sigma factor (sigma-70 family)
MHSKSRRIRSYLDWLTERNYKRGDVDLSNVREAVVRYKLTGYKKDFAVVLALVDNLIIHTVLKLRNRHRVLQNVSTQELYHAGIISLYDALDKMPQNVSEEKVPLWIVAYIKSHIRRDYIYLEKEVQGVGEKHESKAQNDVILNNIAVYDYDLLTLTKLKIINPTEKNLLLARFLDGKKRQNIAKIFHVSEQTISYRTYKAMEKIRAFFVENK